MRLYNYTILLIFPIIIFSQYSNDVIELKKALDTIDFADSGIIGIAGKESDNYNNFSKLKKVATNKELFLMSKYGSDGLRAFSAEELTYRNDENFYKIYMRYLNNPLKVMYYSGCVGEYYNITELIRRKLESIQHVLMNENEIMDNIKDDKELLKEFENIKEIWNLKKIQSALNDLDLIDENYKKFGAVYYEDNYTQQ